MKAILNSLGEPLQEVIRYDEAHKKAGQPIILNAMEQKLCNFLQREFDNKFKNTLGYEINITTLTTIMKKVSEQKFFSCPPADYMAIRVGEGAWSSNLVTYRSFQLGDDFATGILNTGLNNARMASADAGVDSLPINVYDWAKEITWTIIDLQKAAKAGNWDLITSKERSRKTNWDLGIQAVAFLGLAGNSNVLGLFNQPGITTDTATITKPLNSMTPAELSAFAAQVLNLYRANCARTAMPSNFTIPESDYLGLATPTSDVFPILSKLDLLQNTFRSMTMNKNFKLLPCAYGDSAYNTFGKQCYALYNNDEESLRMNVPVDYTNTLANSINNFSFQNAAFGEFTGVLAIRPAELYYFKY